MVQLRLTIVLIVGVLQVCTANPISSEEDATTLFSADQLERAKNAGLRKERLVEGLGFGLTFEEMMKFQEMRNSGFTPESKGVAAVIKACEILMPEMEMATSYTSAQEKLIPQLLVWMQNLLNKHEVFGFIRSTVCEYASQPDKLEVEAKSFGLPLVDYLGHRFLKMKAQKTVGAERVIVAKEMCCVHDNRDASDESTVELHQSKFTGLPDGEVTGFDEHWKEYETANTLKSFENVCDFLKTTDQTKDECVVAILDVEATKKANE